MKGMRSRGSQERISSLLRRPSESSSTTSDGLSFNRISNYNIQDVMVDSLMEDVESLTLDDKALTSKQLRVIEDSFKDFVRTEEKLKLVMKALHDRSLDNKYFGARAAKLCANLYSFETDGAKLRRIFLETLQSDFERRDEIRADGIQNFTNAVELVSHSLNSIHLPDGSRIKILAYALLDYMMEMLEDKNEVMTRIFTIQFAISGATLNEMFPDKVEEILIKVRTKITKSATFKRENTVYWLMLSIDLSSHKWGILSEALATFYATRLGKSQVNQLKNAVIAETPSSASSRNSSSNVVVGGGGGVGGGIKNNEPQRNGNKSKDYWLHDDRNSSSTTTVVPKGRPLHGTGKMKITKESPVQNDPPNNWDR